MKNEAVPQENRPQWPVLAVLLSLGAFCFCALGVETAGAAKKLVGKDGRVYACYRVAGKSKGAVRLVAKHGKCRRGERKVNWSVAGPSGSQGASGQTGAGAGGTSGGDGSSGASGVLALETKVLKLSTEVDALKGVLAGVDNEALTKALAAVKGVTNTDLQEAVAAVPAVQLLCGQADTLTDTFNALRAGIGEIEVLGVKLPIGGLPGALTDFTCEP
jgi:hypothetical protein